MANTTLTQTGAQVQAILDKADELPASLGTAGQVLKVNSGGTGLEWAIDNDTGFKIPTITFPSSGSTLTSEQIAILSNNPIVAQVDSNGKWLAFWYKNHEGSSSISFTDIATPDVILTSGGTLPPYNPSHQYLAVNLTDNTFYIAEESTSANLHGNLHLNSSAVISTDPLIVTLTSEEADIVAESDLLYIDPSDLGFDTTLFVNFAWTDISNDKRHFYSIIPTISDSVFEVYHIIFTPGSDNTGTLQLEEGTFTVGNMPNPMTTTGDLIVGGSAGAPTRLAQGSTGQVLKVGANGPEWANESGGSSIPTVTITQSQVVSQDPTQVQLTDEQYQIVANNKQVLFDGTALGVDSVIINYTGSSSNGSANYIIFGYSTSSTNRLHYFYQILIDTSTKIGEFRETTTHVTSIDVDGASYDGEVAMTNGNDVDWDFPYRMSYLTTAPTSANTSGTVEIVVLSSEPAQRYSGYLYIITGSN